MDFLDFNAVNQLLDNKAFLSAVSAMAGALLTKAIAVYRERIKVLEYTVTHDRVGMSTEDAIFGSVQVTWQGHDLNNLYASWSRNCCTGSTRAWPRRQSCGASATASR